MYWRFCVVCNDCVIIKSIRHVIVEGCLSKLVNVMSRMHLLVSSLHIRAFFHTGKYIFFGNAHWYMYEPLRCRISQHRRTFIPLSASLWNDLGDNVLHGVGPVGFKGTQA